MIMKKLVVSLGEILWDIYPDAKYLGGASTNVIIHTHRLGAVGVIISAVGKDRLGDEIIEVLEKINISRLGIQRCQSKPTGTVDVKLGERGVPQFTCSTDVAFDYIQWDVMLEKLAEQVDAVLIGTLAQRNNISRRTIQRFLEITDNIDRVFDVNFRGWSELTYWIIQETLVNTDILKFNETEMNQLRRAFQKENYDNTSFMDWLIEEYDLKLVALSLGEKGCILYDGEKQVFSSGVRVEPVDTTGCGDAFIAGLIVKYLDYASLEEIAEFANYMGAFMATKIGAIPNYTVEDFEDFINMNQDRNYAGC